MIEIIQKSDESWFLRTLCVALNEPQELGANSPASDCRSNKRIRHMNERTAILSAFYASF